MNSQSKIRVLVVDDSFFMKKLLTRLIEEDDSLKVVGTAKDGAEAIEKTKTLKPNVITLDYHLPDMNGAEVISKIYSEINLDKPAIIMISAHVQEGAEATLDCLRAGALDFIAKPSGELSLDIEKIKGEIIRKIHLASKSKVIQFEPQAKKSVHEKSTNQSLTNRLIIIGSSTGGPPVVEEILTNLPKDLPATVIVAQHMPEYFIKNFVSRLDGLSDLKICVAQNGDDLKNSCIFISPADKYLEIFQRQPQSKICLEKEIKEGIKPSINFIMQEAARVYGKNSIGIILTGMGEDGLEGARAIKKAGGRILVQDPKSAAIDSMPESIINAGLADEILEPKQIARRIVELCG